VPANRIGYGRLRIPTEDYPGVHHAEVFAVFAYFYLGEPVRWNYAVSFVPFWARYFRVLGKRLDLILGHLRSVSIRLRFQSDVSTR
jgi:hypothetical protein